MAKKVVALVGSYRRNGAVESLVDEVLAGAEEQGAEVHKIYLVDEKIAYCRNCRQCTQAAGEHRGECAIDDAMKPLLAEIDSSDVVVLASPVNYYNVTAVFRTFLERLVGATYWPWAQPGPKMRTTKTPRKAVLIATSAAPGFLIPVATGAPRALKLAAQSLQAKPVAKLWAGLVAQQAKPKLSPRLLTRARSLGAAL